jgi:hypothetical protein
MVSVTPGYFFQPGKNSLSLKQLAGLPKTPWRDLLATRVGRIDNQGLFNIHKEPPWGFPPLDPDLKNLSSRTARW